MLFNKDVYVYTSILFMALCKELALWYNEFKMNNSIGMNLNTIIKNM